MYFGTALYEFFWGTTPDKRSMHTVAWRKICRPIKNRLGILTLKDTNTALLAKLLWRLVHRPSCLSSTIFTARYGAWASILKGNICNGSVVWRSMTRAPYGFRKGLQWEVGDGKTILFWLDSWLLPEPLLNHSISEVPVDLLSMLVHDVWCLRLGWRLEVLNGLLPLLILHLLEQHRLPGQLTAGDRPGWSLSRSGVFSTHSLRKIMQSPHVSPTFHWRCLWKFQGPSRASLTLWILLHDALPTFELLWKRGILRSPQCPWCNHPI